MGPLPTPEHCRCWGADPSGLTPTLSTSCPVSARPVCKSNQEQQIWGRPQPPRLRPDFPVAAEPWLDHQARPPPRGPRLRAPPWTPPLRPQMPCRDAVSRRPAPQTVSQRSAPLPFYLHSNVAVTGVFPVASSGDRLLSAPARGRDGAETRWASWARVPRSPGLCRASRAVFWFSLVTARCPLDLGAKTTARDKIRNMESHFSWLTDVSRTFCLKASPEKRSYSLVARMIKRQRKIKT